MHCPDCRGVWLDRGELDKLIEKSMAASAPSVRPASVAAPAEPRYEPRYDLKYDKHGRYRKKPKFWLSEFLTDFL